MRVWRLHRLEIRDPLKVVPWKPMKWIIGRTLEQSFWHILNMTPLTCELKALNAPPPPTMAFKKPPLYYYTTHRITSVCFRPWLDEFLLSVLNDHCTDLATTCSYYFESKLHSFKSKSFFAIFLIKANNNIFWTKATNFKIMLHRINPTKF